MKDEYDITGYGFPIVRKGFINKGSQILCEVFRFESEDVISNIDALERHPTWYKREEVAFTTTEGKLVKAEMYLQGPNTEIHLPNLSRIHTYGDTTAKYWSSKKVEAA